MANMTTSAPTSTSSGLRRLARRLGLTARPETFGERFRNSAAVWLALMAYWALASVMLAVFPSTGRSFPPLGVLIHLGVMLAGLAALWCMHQCTFPAAWDERIPAQHLLAAGATAVLAVIVTAITCGRLGYKLRGDR